MGSVTDSVGVLNWKDYDTLEEIRHQRCQAVVESVRALEEMVCADCTAEQVTCCQHLLGSCCTDCTFGERQAEKPGLSREISPSVSHSHLQQ